MSFGTIITLLECIKCEMWSGDGRQWPIIFSRVLAGMIIALVTDRNKKQDLEACNIVILVSYSL